MLLSSRIAVRAMALRPLRTLLTALGIGIGVATVIAMLAVIEGLNTSFASQIAQLGANTLFVTRMPWVGGPDWWKYRNRPKLTEADAEAIRGSSHFALAVAPFTEKEDFDLTFDGRTDGGVTLHGVTPDYPACSDLTLAEGRFLGGVDVEHAAPDVVIGADVAARLFPGLDPVGQPLYVGDQRLTVIGLLAKRGALLGRSMDNEALVPLPLFNRLFGSKQELYIAVLAAPEHLTEAEDEITGILRRSRRVPPEKDDDFSINRQASLLRVYDDATRSLYLAAIAIGLITLVVGGIGIMNIMLVSVRERTREIGVRRALGARRRTILGQFLVESTLVALAGGGGGTLLGLAGARIVDYITPLAASVRPQMVGLGLAFSTVVGVGFGLWPAWRAARLDPIEALRYE